MNSEKACTSWSAPKKSLEPSLPLTRREPRAGSVDEDEIAGIEQAVVVVDDLVGGRGGVRVVCRHDPSRSEGAHVQPHRGRPGTAVIEKGDGPVAWLLAILEVGDVKHRRFALHGLGVLVGSAHGLLAGVLGGGIVPAFRMDDQQTRYGVVVDAVALNCDRTCSGAGLGAEVRVHLLAVVPLRAVSFTRGRVGRRCRVRGRGIRLRVVARGGLGGLRGLDRAAGENEERRRGGGHPLRHERLAVDHDHSPAWLVLRMKAATLSWI